MSDFNDAPNSVNAKKAVIDRTSSTYKNVADVDGNQPYYWYQGIGSLTGGSVSANVTHHGIQVTWEGESVLHTT